MQRTGAIQNAFGRFIIVAGLLYLVLYLIYQFVVKQFTYYDQKFIGQNIQSADLLLRGMAYKTFKALQDRDMQVIGIDGSGGVWVGSNCNALTLCGLFAVFVIAYPGNQINKWWFVPSGILAIHLLNILRVTALAMISYYFPPEYLAFNHTYPFTFLIYGFIFLLWMFWINRFAQKAG